MVHLTKASETFTWSLPCRIDSVSVDPEGMVLMRTAPAPPPALQVVGPWPNPVQAPGGEFMLYLMSDMEVTVKWYDARGSLLGDSNLGRLSATGAPGDPDTQPHLWPWPCRPPGRRGLLGGIQRARRPPRSQAHPSPLIPKGFGFNPPAPGGQTSGLMCLRPDSWKSTVTIMSSPRPSTRLTTPGAEDAVGHGLPFIERGVLDDLVGPGVVLGACRGFGVAVPPLVGTYRPRRGGLPVAHRGFALGPRAAPAEQAAGHRLGERAARIEVPALDQLVGHFGQESRTAGCPARNRNAGGGPRAAGRPASRPGSAPRRTAAAPPPGRARPRRC